MQQEPVRGEWGHGGKPCGSSAVVSGADNAHRDAAVDELFRHLACAVATHVRRLAQQGLEIPDALGELHVVLIGYGRSRQDASMSARSSDRRQDAFVPEQLLVTKGEAAQRLSVSVRTIERLVARGRLPKVHIEGSVRFRVGDLEAFVAGLDGVSEPEPERANQLPESGGPGRRE